MENLLTLCLPLDRPLIFLCKGKPHPFIAWIHAVPGAVAVVPFGIPRTRRTAALACLPLGPEEELGKRSSHRTLLWPRVLFFICNVLPLVWLSLRFASQVALTYAVSVMVGLVFQQAGHPDLIRSPKRVLSHHLWEEDSQF